MKRILLALSLSLGLLSGCIPVSPSPTPPEGPTEPPAATASPAALERDEEPDWVSCRIVDGAEEGELLLAELDHELTPHSLSHADGKSVYRLSLDGVGVYLDGEPAQASDLRDGMNVEISFNGMVLETFPAQLGEAYELRAYSIGTRQCPGGGYFDLCGLYLQVLDDLWEKDPGLNSGIDLAGLDLSKAPGGLLESEKAALCRRFGEAHGVEVVEGTFETLAEEGYFTSVSDDSEHPLYQWENGCLFSITAAGGHEDEIYSLPVLFFNVEKWCSPLGAYYFQDCSALWPEAGTWSGYTVGGEAIS